MNNIKYKIGDMIVIHIPKNGFIDDKSLIGKIFKIEYVDPLNIGINNPKHNCGGKYNWYVSKNNIRPAGQLISNHPLTTQFVPDIKISTNAS